MTAAIDVLLDPRPLRARERALHEPERELVVEMHHVLAPRIHGRNLTPCVWLEPSLEPQLLERFHHLASPGIAVGRFQLGVDVRHGLTAQPRAEDSLHGVAVVDRRWRASIRGLAGADPEKQRRDREDAKACA